MLTPTLPVYATKLGGSAADAGLVVAVITLSALIIRPFSGVALDMLGRRVIMLAGNAICLVFIGGYLLAGSVIILLLVRLFHGVGWGISSTTYGTMASDLVPMKRRGEGLGYFGLASTLSMALGPMLGIHLSNKYGFTMLFTVSLTATLLAAILAQCVSSRNLPDPSAQKKLAEPFVTRLFERSALLPACLALLLAITYGGIVSFITLFGQEQGIANVGWFFLVNALSMLAVRTFAGKVFDKKGHVWILVPGVFISAVGLLLLSTATSSAGLIPAAICYGSGFGAIHPSLQAWAVNRTAQNRRGAANALFFSAFDMGIGIGAVILGALAEVTHYAVMYRYACVALALFLAVYVIYLRKAANAPSNDTDKTMNSHM